MTVGGVIATSTGRSAKVEDVANKTFCFGRGRRIITWFANEANLTDFVVVSAKSMHHAV
jgi:hypothetical protein